MLAGNLPLLASYARAFLASSVGYAFLYGYTQWLEDSRRLSASAAGLLLLPVFGAAIVVSALTGRRAQVRAKLLVGAATQVLVCALLLVVDAGSGIWLLAVLAVIMGVPQGLNNLATQNAVYAQADPDRIGSSAGLLRTFLYLGAITASAASGAFFPHRASTSGLHHLAVFMLACATAFLLVTALDWSLARVGARSRTANR